MSPLRSKLISQPMRYISPSICPTPHPATMGYVWKAGPNGRMKQEIRQERAKTEPTDTPDSIEYLK